ncbi:putative Vacuolar protein sorting-associated protein 28 [Paratrimastix pyriformis]|uniref:Vacuolar protein sorting-associated protein 28 homolog n=1 Tax=Paratrimastix pyriformis TaxID=342808 RepID=A0ABQ8UBK6_9EUKA|nr:putative Vacuolar protein sorting-associated protein 28 [Paratrimastix pyriformis]
MASLSSVDLSSLVESVADREKLDHLSELYSLIIVVDQLEKAYVSDAIPAEEYTPLCSKFIGQYKMLQGILHFTNEDVIRFMREYKLECRAAANRLLTTGVPATTEHAAVDGSKLRDKKHIFETVQFFITAMDSIRLGMVACDQLHPLLADLMTALNKVDLPPEYDGKARVAKWLQILNGMHAKDELNPDQTRELNFDLDTAFQALHNALS